MVVDSLRTGLTIGLVALLGWAVAVAPADVPPRSDGGQTLVVPAEHLALGEVYHVTPGVGTQLVWSSDAPLLRMMAVCNRVVGYIVAPFDIEEGQPPLLAGAFRIPVASLSTGLAQYDTELRSEAGLNVAAYPEMTLEITAVDDAKVVPTDDGRKSYTVQASAKLTVKKTTVEVSFPLRMTLVPFTWQTMQLNLGDFFVLRAEFDVKMAELDPDSQARRSADRSADVAHFDLFLLCSTVSPEKNVDPSVKQENHIKQLRFLTLLRDLQDADKAYEFGREYMRQIWDNGPALNRLAWAALTEDGVELRDLAFITRAVERANELTVGGDPAVLHTLARLHHHKQDMDAALDWARQAVAHLGDTPPYVAVEIRATLERYEQQAGARED